jgi:hypothetical protein
LVLLCAATRIEAWACQWGVSRKHARLRFEVLRTGVGLKRAKRALRTRLSSSTLIRPDLIISTGFAGSLDPSNPIGKWIHGPSDFDFASVLEKSKVNWEYAQFIHAAKIDTSSGIGCGWAVDMESSALEEISRGKSIPFGILRMVSDTPSQAIPESILTLINALADGLIDASIKSSLIERCRTLLSACLDTIKGRNELFTFLWRSHRLPLLLSKGWQRFSSDGVFLREVDLKGAEVQPIPGGSEDFQKSGETIDYHQRFRKA